MSSPASSSHRLLYRGALSLPDSHLLLDGLTFAARVGADNKLLDNPLALALESMRGRPTLRFMGTVSLKDIYLDPTGDITLDIHSDAFLSRIYFENMFCIKSPSQNSIGVRVALGDTDGPETTQIVIFADVQTLDSSSVHLTVARISHEPVSLPTARLPRPDDPTPRRPPPVLVSKGRDMHNAGSVSSNSKRQKLQDGTAATLGTSVRLGQQSKDAVFKVPPNPPGKAKRKLDDDVFGSTELTDAAASKKIADPKGKRKQIERDNEEEAMERDNKTVIKQTAVQQLKLTPITKTHPEYNEIYRWIYRGVEFALRADMRTRPLDPQDVSRLVKIHADMYTAQALVLSR